MGLFDGVGDLLGGLKDVSSAVAPIADIAGVATTGVPWGSIASGGLALAGGMMSNNANANQAQMANQFSAQQTQKQMDFQREMRETQYQTSVSDLKKAGLNPMLAYTQGGAGTPSGASSAGQQATYQNAMAPAIGAYNQTAQTAMEMDKLPSIIKKIVQETLTSGSQADLNDENRKYTSTNTDRTVQDILNLKVENRRLEQEIKYLISKRGLTDASARKVNQDYGIDLPDFKINTSDGGVAVRSAERITNSAKGLVRAR